MLALLYVLFGVRLLGFDLATPRFIVEREFPVEAAGDTLHIACEIRCPYPWIEELSLIYAGDSISAAFVVPVEEFTVPVSWVGGKIYRLTKFGTSVLYETSNAYIAYHEKTYLGYPIVIMTPKP